MRFRRFYFLPKRTSRVRGSRVQSPMGLETNMVLLLILLITMAFGMVIGIGIGLLVSQMLIEIFCFEFEF